MARTTGKLDSRTVASRRKPGYYGDGAGLWLQVTASGSKTWVFRFKLNGRAREMGLGALHTVSLAEARNKARAARGLLTDGIDPIEHKRAEKAARALENGSTKTFDECSRAYIDSQKAGWGNSKHADQWTNTLATYASPVFGTLPVSAIDTARVMRALEPIWTTKPETASRIRGRIEAVLSWATVHGYRQGENPARWRGHLDKLLPKTSKVATVKHHQALPYQQIGEFMKALRAENGTAARALELCILTATRTSEVIKAKWSEFDLAEGLWTIPAERMKARREHRVPLSPAAVKLLEKEKRKSDGGWVFPGVRYGKHLSNMAMLELLRRMGQTDITVHGFRSTFRDWTGEMTAYPHEVAEMALAHTISNKAEAAYRRGDLFAKRARMMEDWAAFCALPPQDAKIVGMKSKQQTAS